MQPSMGFCEAIKTVMGKNYCNFSGRARRSEFWFFQLFCIIIEAIFGPFSLTTTSTSRSSYNGYDSYSSSSQISIFGYIYIIFILVFFIPNLAVSVRRLHDIGKSGCFFLIAIIPIVGIFILLYFFCIDSQEVPNEYGPSPKYNSALQNNTNQNLINQNGPIYSQDNIAPSNAYPQQQPPMYQQPYQNPVPQQPYQSPVPPESYQSGQAQPYQNPTPQQPYQSPVPPESYQTAQAQPYQNAIPPDQNGFIQQYPSNPAPPEGFGQY